MDALTALAETEREQCVTVDIREHSGELPVLYSPLHKFKWTVSTSEITE